MVKTYWKACALFCIVLLCTASASDADNAPRGQNDVKTRSETFISGDKTVRQAAGDGVTRQILGYDENVMLVKVEFRKGSVGTPHTHPHTQTTYVVSGKFEFTVGGEKKIVKAGDSIYMAPDILHGCVCLKAGTLIDCFSPMRRDFMDW